MLISLLNIFIVLFFLFCLRHYHCDSQSNLEILSPQPPEFYNYKHSPRSSFQVSRYGLAGWEAGCCCHCWCPPPPLAYILSGFHGCVLFTSLQEGVSLTWKILFSARLGRQRVLEILLSLISEAGVTQLCQVPMWALGI